MSARCLCPALLILVALPRSAAADPKPIEHPATALARRIWAVSEAVLDRHFDPPARQELFLGAAQALFRTTNMPAPTDLARRVSALTTREQLAAFLKEAWPRDKEPAGLEDAMLRGLFLRLSGGGSLTPAAAHKVDDQIAFNRYVGLGIQIRRHPTEQLPEIITPIRGGPAHRAGIKPKTLIVTVDGKTTKDVNLGKVIEMLRGEEGSKVTLVVRRTGEKESRTLEMTRSVVPFPNVEGYRRGKKKTWEYRVSPSEPVGYAVVSMLSSSTLHELRLLERDLRAEGVQALVLDLRTTNRDALLEHAGFVADGLLDGGVLWRTRDRRGAVRERKADRDCLFRGWPLVVLVGKETGQASAWLVAALQDNRRAVIVGKPLLLTPVVRSHIPLPDNLGVLTLVTAILERAQRPPVPIEARLNSVPLEPDHAVALSQKQKEALHEWLRSKAFTELPPGVKDEPPEDPALVRAVELLRASLKDAKAGEGGH